jgi:hypothetical protein
MLINTAQIILYALDADSLFGIALKLKLTTKGGAHRIKTAAKHTV